MSSNEEHKQELTRKNGKSFLQSLFGSSGNQDILKGDKQYHGFFFKTVNRLTYLFLIAGLVMSTYILLIKGEPYKAFAIVFLLIWLVVFLRYFIWAVYHYNVNYGLTEQDWEDIREAQAKKAKGLPVDEKATEAPEYNPYRSQTFGLPPGTVRGMIAFTLLFGSITLLITGMGMSQLELENSLIRDQFEFFKTAFLMMIAFYFGDKSLRFLQKRWRDPNKGIDRSNANIPEPQTIAPTTNELDEDDQDYGSEEKVFAETEKPDALVKSNLSQLKSALHRSVGTTPKSPIETTVETEYKNAEDLAHEKILSDQDIMRAIQDLKSKGTILQFPVLKAIIEVESGGRGHLSDGRPKILFEGHKFWHWLKENGINPEDKVDGNEDILYPRWTKAHYQWGAKEYFRFERAKAIDPKAAVYACSWGLFQIMGENLESNIKSRVNRDSDNPDIYKDYNDFVVKQEISEYYHLLDFLAFITTKKVDGKPLIDYVSGNDELQFDWAKFAYGYNGAGYAQNQYDRKLKEAYQKHKRLNSFNSDSTSKLIPIIDCGHGGLNENGNYTTTKGKKYTFNGDEQESFTIYEGVINRQIGGKLISKLKEAGIAYLDLNSNDSRDMKLSDRVKVADDFYARNKNCFYLSIHSNSASTDLKGNGSKAHGFEIFTSRGKTQSDRLAKVIADKYKTHFPDISFRGLKESNFHVLKYTDCPAVLVENLFFDNYEEALFLKSEEGQEKITACLFDAIKTIVS